MAKGKLKNAHHINIRANFLVIITLLVFGLSACKSLEETTNSDLTFRNQQKEVLDFQRYGNSGESLVFLHGLGSNSKAWQKLIPLLENEFIVYTIDLPKHLDKDDKSLVNIAEYARLVHQFIKGLSEEKIHVIGHSMGGQVAIKLALDEPNSISSLGLLAPAGFEQFNEADINWFNTWVTKKYYLSLGDDAIEKSFDINFYGLKLPDDARFMLEDRLALKLDAVKYGRYIDYVLKAISSMLNEPVYDQLSNISVPTIVFFGKDDQLIPNKILHPSLTVNDIIAVADQIPNAEKHLIDKAGHFIQWDQPSQIAKLLSKFLNKNQSNE